MTEPKTIVLAGREIAVPPLPLRLNMLAYPLCRKLTNGGYVERYLTAFRDNAAVEVSEEEFADLAELAFLGALAAEPLLDRAAFDEWHVTPPELLNAFFPIRLQTGGWIAGPEPGQETAHTGEATGAETPLT